jgi:hypothetical protein
LVFLTSATLAFPQCYADGGIAAVRAVRQSYPMTGSEQYNVPNRLYYLQQEGILASPERDLDIVRTIVENGSTKATSGVGGRVLKSGDPIWITNVTADFPMAGSSLVFKFITDRPYEAVIRGNTTAQRYRGEIEVRFGPNCGRLDFANRA